MTKKRVLSGMRPTGRLHLGHYFGALKNYVAIQDTHECFFMVADWHALTSDYADTSNIRENVIDMVIDWLSVGIDPKKAVIFRQSEVPQHSELFLILSMITPLGWLQRCPTYKEQLKEIQNKDLNNYGFLGYPVLMASDILLYKANEVPVGEDQLAHLEFSREITRRFNNFYGDVLVEPQALLTKTARVPGLDKRKMSKSYGNSILLAETDEDIAKKVKTMYTDPLRIKATDPGHPDGCVVFAFHEIFNKDAQTRKQECINGCVGCVKCKKELTEMICEFSRPILKKRQELANDKKYVEDILKEGSVKAEQVASQTMKEIREAVKL
ncbi:MAG: tryptophan--tRNA ligase [Elusimicrobia bacterium]|jgi:tryptophanyl-tRNA synthetase|nr:tryptophan--tRNA ligase [Elusimicrobiota bacterium]